MNMETEKCEKCGVEVEKGTLIRDSVDSSQLRCNKCIVPDKKPRKPRKKKEIPMGLSVPTAEIMMAKAAKYPQKESPPIDPDILKTDVEKWAQECGLGKVNAIGPTREDYPYYGFGYSFHIQEISGKQRKASARYTSQGLRSFWTIDGIVTG